MKQTLLKKRKRKGAILPLVAFILVMLILILGLMVELNWLYYTRFESQSAADLSSRSALAALYANEEKLDNAAIDRAKEFGAHVFSLNSGGNQATSQDLIFGSTSQKQFNEIGSANQFRSITASQLSFGDRYRPILGSLMVKKPVDLSYTSVSEASRIELVVCLDASRSMNYTANGGSKFPPGGNSIHEPPLNGSRWFALLDAMDQFFDQINHRSGDTQLGLVTFGGGSSRKPKVESPLDNDLARSEIALGDFQTHATMVTSKLNNYTNLPALGYGTSIYDGIEQSTSMLARSTKPAKRIILLFTDGNQSNFVFRPSEIVASERAEQEGIAIFTIGYRVNGKNLQTIADMTGGSFYSVNNSAQLQAALKEIANLFKVRLTQ